MEVTQGDRQAWMGPGELVVHETRHPFSLDRVTGWNRWKKGVDAHTSGPGPGGSPAAWAGTQGRAVRPCARIFRRADVAAGRYTRERRDAPATRATTEGRKSNVGGFARWATEANPLATAGETCAALATPRT